MNFTDKDYIILHDHMQAIARERDWLQKEVDRLTDELNLAIEALVRYRNPPTDNGVNWRNIATMLSHFDVCTSARINCNICHEARQAYLVGLTT